VTDDWKWLAGIGVTILAAYYYSVIALYSIAAGLYGRDKLSYKAWRMCTIVFGIALGLPVLGGGGLVAYSRGLLAGLLLGVVLTGVGTILLWQRRTMAAIVRHSWPPLAMFGTLMLVAIATVRTRDPLVILLGATTLLFAWCLLRDRLRLSLATGTSTLAGFRGRFARPLQRVAWTYPFIEHLDDKSTVCEMGPGSQVRRVQNAKSHTVLPEAIFEHPQDTKDDTVIRFCVAGVHRSVTKLKLLGSYSVLEQFVDKDEKLKECDFRHNIGNRVRFEVRVDGRPLLCDERVDYGWVTIDCKEPITPRTGTLSVELRTNCMGDPSCNWAAWGDLKLVEWK